MSNGEAQAPVATEKGFRPRPDPAQEVPVVLDMRNKVSHA
jgi:hypothetical protein